MGIEQTISRIKGNTDQFFRAQFEELPAVGAGVGRKIYVTRVRWGALTKSFERKIKVFRSVRQLCLFWIYACRLLDLV